MTRWVWVIAGLLLASSSAQAQTPYPTARTTSAGPRPTSAAAAKPTWEIDTTRSKLTFNLRHLIGRTEGKFDTWSGTLTVPPNDWNKATVDVTIKAASINTDNRARDKHLRSADFFDADNHPEITFKSTSVKRESDSVFVTGNLTMRGVTKPVTLRGKFLGAMSGDTPQMSFQATTVINRLDYGVSYNRMAEGGGTILGDDVTIETTVVAVPKQ